MSKTILITGGAGFIGSHVNKILNEKGYSTVVIDDLRSGSKDSVLSGKLIIADFGDKSALNKVFSEENIAAVIHCAASTNVGESSLYPEAYYENNVAKSITLFNTMVEYDIRYLIFSSSAAVYGNPKEKLITESHCCEPINPYGKTKLLIDELLSDYQRAEKLFSVSLRYFNAAGGDPDGLVKVDISKKSNVIPIVINCISNKSPFTIFGTDYSTKDGTCVRDYIHVMDLAEAHVLSLEKLFEKRASSCYNLGNGCGFSVKEIIEAAIKVSGREITVLKGDRRPGDPPFLLADATKAKKELGWVPHYCELETMVEHAWHGALFKNREKETV